MQIGSRFTEYGLTGGFFWICQLILLWYSGQTQALLSNLSTVQLQIPTGISQIGSTAITSLVGALAIIAVFVAGLLLDLLAAYFRPMEMRVFHRHLVRNRDWVGRLIADHKGYCQPDYEQFERRFGESSFVKDMLAGCDILGSLGFPVANILLNISMLACIIDFKSARSQFCKPCRFHQDNNE